MKTEHLIVQYLYSNKKMALQDIGTFTLSPDISIDPESDKDFALPPDAIRFDYDPRTEPDDGLVQYITDHSRKMRALAYSDLESFIMLNKQFLNIGKPLILEGLGTLQKTQIGEYAFTQAGTSHVIREESPKLITEKQKEKISFITPPKDKSNGNGKSALGVLLLLLMLGAAFAAYYFYNKNQENNSPEIPAQSDPEKADSSSMQKTADTPAARTAIPDPNSFYIVLNEYPNIAAAEKRVKVLNNYGHNAVIQTDDSVNYKIRMSFVAPLSDTLRAKDSISKLLSPKAYIELP